MGGVVWQAWGAVNKTWDVTVHSQSGITCGVRGGGWREIQLEQQVRVSMKNPPCQAPGFGLHFVGSGGHGNFPSRGATCSHLHITKRIGETLWATD